MKKKLTISELVSGKKRLPAEWEAQEGILMAWPHINSDWAEIIDEAREQFARLVAALLINGDKVFLIADNREECLRYLREWFQPRMGDFELYSGLLMIEECEYNDTWTRDYGPLSVQMEGVKNPVAVDFCFNAWGMKFAANLDNCVNHRIEESILRNSVRVDSRDFILEGGSVETDGEGTLLTTTECLLNENRNPTLNREEIEKLLSDRLGLDRYLWLNHGHIEGDDTDSHIDTLARLAPGETILYCGAGEEPGKMHDSLVAMRDELREFRTRSGNPYNLIELPLPDPIREETGKRYAATYANFLVTPHAVYVPLYGQPQKDEMAQMMLRAVYHDRSVIGVDCRTLIKQGGSLHCSTMQLLPGTR